MEGEPAKREHRVFDPASRAYRWRLWIKYYSAQKGRRHRHVYWRRVGLLLATLGVTGWLGLTAAAWSLVRYQRGFTHARYRDLALPWRWPNYQHELSADYLARSEAELVASKWDPALTDLMAALSLDPDNLATRRQVAERQFGLGLGSAAWMTLRDQAPAGYRAGDEAYLRDLFSIAFSLGMSEDALALGRRLLPQRSSPQRLPLFVAYQTAVALERLKQYPSAIQLLRDWQLGGLPEGVALWARCEWEAGHRTEAAQVAEAGLERFPHNDELYRTEEEWARERKDLVVVHRLATLRVLASPGNAEVRLDELFARRDLGTGPELDREILAFLADFSGNPGALGQVAGLAVELGRPEIVRRARDLAQSQAKADLIAYFTLGIVQADVIARDYPQALKDLPQPFVAGRGASPALDSLRAGLDSIAQWGVDAKNAKEAFGQFLLRVPDLGASDGIFLIRALRALGKGSEALKLQELLAEHYPQRADVRVERDSGSDRLQARNQ